MGSSCAIPRCSVRYKKKSEKGTGSKFYSVPCNKERRRTWLNKIPFLREYSNKQLDNFRICGKHFLPNHLSSNNRLTADALPTLHLPPFNDVPYIGQDTQSDLSQSNKQLDVNIVDMPALMSDSTSCTIFQTLYTKELNSESLPVNALETENETVSREDFPRNAQFTALTPLKYLIMSDEPFQSGPGETSGDDNSNQLCLKLSKCQLNSTQKTSRKQKIRIQQTFLKLKLRSMQLRLQKLKNKNYLRKVAILLKKELLLKNFGKVLIDSQLHLTDKLPKVCEYSNDEKVFILSLYKFSPKCYTFLRKYMLLPHVSNITSVLSYIPLRPGINDFVFQYLASTAKNKSVIGKQCVLLFKEMPVTKNLYFNFHSGVIEGFEDLGSGFRSLNAADKVLVFMLRGLVSPWKIPVAFYFICNDINLKNIIKEVIGTILKTGFCVKATVSNQDSANITAVKSLIAETHVELLLGGDYLTELFYYKVDDHKMYHIFDMPHLLVGFRNFFQEKDIVVGRQHAKWEYIESLYKIDSYKNMTRSTKLTETHINPQPCEKTNVILAAQVFSKQVSMSLQLYMKFLQEFHMCHNYSTMDYNEESGFFTAEILMFMNDLFDSLNGFRNKSSGLKNSLSHNSEHIEFWNHAVKKLESMTFDGLECSEDKNAIMKHFVHNIKAIKLLWAELQDIGIKFLNLRRLNLEPLQLFLSQIRKNEAFSLNSDCHNFIDCFKTLLLNNIERDNTLFSKEDKVNKILNVIKYATPEIKFTGCEEEFSCQIEQLRLIEIPFENDLHSNSVSFIADAVCNYLSPKLNSSKCEVCRSILMSDRESHDFLDNRDYVEGEKRLSHPSNNLMKFIKHSIYFIESLLPNMCHVYIYQEIIAEFKKIDTSWYSCQDHKSNFLDAFWLLVIRLQTKQWCSHFNSRIS